MDESWAEDFSGTNLFEALIFKYHVTFKSFENFFYQIFLAI